VKKNIIVGFTSWSEVCRISRAMARSLGVCSAQTRLLTIYDDIDLAYMANDSIGGRAWRTDGVPADTQPSFNGSYFGWAEAQSEYFKWTSATSGAVIEATFDATEAQWCVRFEGADLDRYSRESAYARIVANIAWTAIESAEFADKLAFENSASV